MIYRTLKHGEIFFALIIKTQGFFIYIIITYKEELVLILNMDTDKEKKDAVEQYEDVQRIR